MLLYVIHIASPKKKYAA